MRASPQWASGCFWSTALLTVCPPTSAHANTGSFYVINCKNYQNNCHPARFLHNWNAWSTDHAAFCHPRKHGTAATRRHHFRIWNWRPNTCNLSVDGRYHSSLLCASVTRDTLHKARYLLWSKYPPCVTLWSRLTIFRITFAMSKPWLVITRKRYFFTRPSTMVKRRHPRQHEVW